MPWRFNPFTGNLDETDIPAFNGEVTIGSASNPSIFFTGDTNTGIYSPGADQVAISTNGAQRISIGSDGDINIDSGGVFYDASTKRLGIGTTSPIALFNTQQSSGGAEAPVLFQNFSTSPGTSVALYLSPSSGGLTTGSIRAAAIKGIADSSNIVNLAFFTNSSGADPVERARIDSSGRLLVGTSSNSGGALLQVNGDRIRVATAKTPASATATGTAGEICWDANYIYVCTATNTWKRAALSTW